MRKWKNKQAKDLVSEGANITPMQIGEPANVMGALIIERVHEDAVIPTYASEGDSGMDIYATESIVVMPGFNGIIKTGLKMAIPKHPLHDLGYRYECQVRPRSGVSLKTYLRVANAPGTIDNFYRDEIGVILTNIADKTHYLNGVDYVLTLKDEKIPTADVDMNKVPDNTYLISKGDRIAQLVFNEVIRPMAITEGTVTEEDSRGGGFGHTGV